MRLVLVLVMFFTLSSAVQKQIILGSYVVEKNAQIALEKLKSNVEANEKLQAFIKQNNLQLENRKIGKYTVVSVREFDSYVWLFRTIEELQKTYGDAYAIDIKVTAQAMESNENFTVTNEVEVADASSGAAMHSNETTTQPTAQTEQSDANDVEVVKDEAVELTQGAQQTEEAIQEPETEEAVVEPKPKKVQKQLKEDKKQQNDKPFSFYYYIIAGLVAVILLVLIIATIIKRKINPKEEEELS